MTDLYLHIRIYYPECDEALMALKTHISTWPADSKLLSALGPCIDAALAKHPAECVNILKGMIAGAVTDGRTGVRCAFIVSTVYSQAIKVPADEEHLWDISPGSCLDMILLNCKGMEILATRRPSEHGVCTDCAAKGACLPN